MKPTWCTIFSVYFVSFIYNLYMLRISPGPSSGGITVFMRHLVFCYSVQLAVWCAGQISCTPHSQLCDTQYFVILYSYFSLYFVILFSQLCGVQNGYPAHHTASYSTLGILLFCIAISLSVSLSLSIYIYIYIYIYRVSQEECARLREGVPYVKVYRYNPKHLCPKLNGYEDNGQRSLKL